jgi:cation diffusion facilitator family transporter
LTSDADAAAAKSAHKVVHVALAGNLLVTATKFTAAAITGSSAMLSEAIHSLVDTGNEVLLLYGLRRASVPPDEDHPFGHGREVYFWSFVVAVLIFGLGAGLSLYEGIQHVLSPHPIERAAVNYAVIALALVFEGASWRVAYREFRRSIRDDTGVIEAAVRSKDPTTFMVLFEDSAAVIGLLIALGGTIAAETLRAPVLDGVASLGIGALLAVVAGFLARESKGLLIGEPAQSEVVRGICAIARAQPGVERSSSLFTVHVGPRRVVAAISVDFRDDLSAADVERIVADIEQAVHAAHPEVVSLLVKPQGADGFRGRPARGRERD